MMSDFDDLLEEADAVEIEPADAFSGGGDRKPLEGWFTFEIEDLRESVPAKSNPSNKMVVYQFQSADERAGRRKAWLYLSARHPTSSHVKAKHQKQLKLVASAIGFKGGDPQKQVGCELDLLFKPDDKDPNKETIVGVAKAGSKAGKAEKPKAKPTTTARTVSKPPKRDAPDPGDDVELSEEDLGW
jgi:hypothetical protein